MHSVDATNQSVNSFHPSQQVNATTASFTIQNNSISKNNFTTSSVTEGQILGSLKTPTTEIMRGINGCPLVILQTGMPSTLNWAQWHGSHIKQSH